MLLLQEGRRVCALLQAPPQPKGLLKAWTGQTKTVVVTTVVSAVHTLFTHLQRREKPTPGALTKASLTLLHAGFGLVVYKHPRPGVIHVYNKKFGGRPNVLAEQPLDLGLLTSARNQFV